jgi:hypothetical protein
MNLQKIVKSALLVAGVALTLAAATGSANANTFTVINNCGYTVYPGLYPAVYQNGGWSMAPGSSVSFGVATNFNGRIWGRQGCNSASPAQCASGSCGGSGLQCAGTTGQLGTSLAEFNLNANGTDWYDVSYVDGQDTPIGITVSNSSCVQPNVGSKISCPTTVQNGVDCLSPCTQTGNPQYCCSGSYGTSSACQVSTWPANDQAYVNNIHAACPHTYAYAYDDPVGLLTCPTGGGNNYTITFCPGGSSSTGGGTTGGGGTISAGIHTLTPQCAPSERLDDNAGGTANGNPVQIWQANGLAPQQWNFASIGGNNYNLAVNEGPYCLDDMGGAQGTQVAVWSCNGNVNQSWTVNTQNGGYALIDGSGLCLDVANGTPANGTQVRNWPCNNSSAQTWMADYTTPTIGNGVHTLTPQCATGSRLDDNAAGTGNGNPVQIWQANGSAAQQWNFNNIGGSNFNLAVNLGPYCLDDMGGSQGTQAAVWSCNGNVNQTWTATALQGGFMFQNGGGLCLDVSGAGSSNGTKVQSWPCNYGSAQNWAVN